MQEEFIEAIHQYIRYWDNQNGINSKEKLEGLAFSILCMLDGISGSFSGSINELCKGNEVMLHELLYAKQKSLEELTKQAQDMGLYE